MNWKQEIIPLIVSAAFGALVLGLFVIATTFVAEFEKYQVWSSFVGLAFFGMAVSFPAFFIVLVYGVPVYLILQSLRLRGLPYYLLAGLLPAFPMMVLDYPELFASLRLAAFGAVASTSTFYARFAFFAERTGAAA